MIQADFLFLSVPEAAKALKVTDARVRQLLISGEIHGRKLGKKNWAIDPSEVTKYQQVRRLPGKPRRKS